MNKYKIIEIHSDYKWIVEAKTPSTAMMKVLDKHYNQFYGPVYVDPYWEIYNDMGMRIQFKIMSV